MFCEEIYQNKPFSFSTNRTSFTNKISPHKDISYRSNKKSKSNVRLNFKSNSDYISQNGSSSIGNNSINSKKSFISNKTLKNAHQIWF